MANFTLQMGTVDTFSAGMGLDKFPLALALALALVTEAVEDCLVVWPFQLPRDKFQESSESVWRLILDPFCPLMPPARRAPDLGERFQQPAG